MRAAIFASLRLAPKDEKEREYLHRLIAGTFNPKTQMWEGGIVDWDGRDLGRDVDRVARSPTDYSAYS
jgi:hypothetical protein